MRETAENFASELLGNERRVWVREPLHDAHPPRVVVFLDAEMYRDKVGAPEIINAMQESGEIADSWVVYVSSLNPDVRWEEAPCYPPFASFLSDELVPWLRRRYCGAAEATEWCLVGLSYTALAASYAAKTKPGAFQRVVCQSGSFWWKGGWLIEQYARDPLRVPTEFYLHVGSRETQVNLLHRGDVFQEMSQLEAVREFRDALLERGYNVAYHEGAGSHDAAAWKADLPDALRWALPNTPATLPHAFAATNGHAG